MEKEKKKSLALFILLTTSAKRFKLSDEVIQKELERKHYYVDLTKNLMLLLSFVIGKRFYDVTNKKSMLPAFGMGFVFFTSNMIFFNWTYFYFFSKAYKDVVDQYQDEILSKNPDLLDLIGEKPKVNPVVNEPNKGSPQNFSRKWEFNSNNQDLRGRPGASEDIFGQYREQSDELDNKKIFNSDGSTSFQSNDDYFFSEKDFKPRNPQETQKTQNYFDDNIKKEDSIPMMKTNEKKPTFVSYRFNPES